MAVYPTLTKTDLESYSGRPEGVYTDFANQALIQAVLLFKLATCLSDWPDDPDMAQLAQYAVLSLADTLILTQPFRAAMATPFSNESIGSYSYSKLTTQIQNLLPTGISWFDLAVERLGVCLITARVERGSIRVFEDDAFIVDEDNTGKDQGGRRLLGPADIHRIDYPFDISHDATFYPQQP